MSIIKLFSLPVFDDKETQRMAKVLFFLTLSIGLLFDVRYVTQLFLLPGQTTRWVTLLAFYNLAFLTTLILTQKGKVMLASQLFCYFLVVSIVITSWTGGGIQGEPVAYIPFAIMYTGLLLGWKRATVIGSVLIVWCGFLYYAETHHFLPQNQVVRSTLSLTIYTVLQIVLLALLQYLTMDNLNKALAEAKKELTTRKMTEELLRKSEDFRKRVFESSRIPIVVMDGITYAYVDCNQAAVDIYQFASKDYTLGKTPLDVSPPLQYDGVSSDVKAKEYIEKARNAESFEFEWLHRRQSGELWDGHVHLMRFKAEGKEFFQFTLLDITARKKAEALALQYQAKLEQMVEVRTEELAAANEKLAATIDELEEKVQHRTAEMRETNEQYYATIIEFQKKTDALAESEKRYDVLINSIMHSVLVSSIEGEIFFFNRAAQELFGVEKEERSTLRTTDYWVDKSRQHTFRQEIQEKGFVYNFEAEVRTKGNAISTLIISSTLIEYHGKRVILSIFNDITTQKALEHQILTSTIETEERERHRFAQELHDGLGPLLSAAKMYLQWIAKDEGKPIIPSLITKTIGLVDEAHKTTREISHNLSPHILQNFGFVAAIRNLAERTNGIYNLSIVFSDDFDSHDQAFRQMGLHAETVLYRTLSECINNTIKHAKATSISVSAQAREHHLVITYKDNGVGFNVSRVLENRKGMGLYSMKNRVEAIKGELLVDSLLGEGATITISVKCEV